MEEEVWRLSSVDDLSFTSVEQRSTRRIDRAPGPEEEDSFDEVDLPPRKAEKAKSAPETLRSMHLEIEDNKIMRVPNMSMMLHHERELNKFLHNVQENPAHFASFVGECRVASDRHNAQYEPPDDVTGIEGDVQDEFRIEKQIAATRFARVFYAMRLQDRFPCALKQLRRMPRLVRRRPTDARTYNNGGDWLGQYSFLENHTIMAEINRLREIEHANIISVFDAFEEHDFLNIVSEWCAGGSLAYKLLNLARRRSTLDERTVWAYFSQICAGVEHLHDKDLYHLNLRPANVLFNTQGQIKISDLGVHALERRVYTGLQNDVIGQEIDALCGICPEILGDFLKEIEERSFCNSETELSTGVTISAAKAAAGDAWALGSILYEMAELRPPFLFPGMQGNPLALVRTSLRMPATLGMSNIYTKRVPMLVERLLISRSVDRMGVRAAAQAALKACCDENESFYQLLMTTKNTYDSPKYADMNRNPWAGAGLASRVAEAFGEGTITSGEDILHLDSPDSDVQSATGQDGINSPDPVINSAEFEQLCSALEDPSDEIENLAGIEQMNSFASADLDGAGAGSAIHFDMPSWMSHLNVPADSPQLGIASSIHGDARPAQPSFVGVQPDLIFGSTAIARPQVTDRDALIGSGLAARRPRSLRLPNERRYNMTAEQGSEAKTPLAMFAQPAPINTAVTRSVDMGYYPQQRFQTPEGSGSGTSTPSRRKRQHNPLSPEQNHSPPPVMLVDAGRTHSEPSLFNPRRRGSPSAWRMNRRPTPPRHSALGGLEYDRRSRNGTPTHSLSQLSLMSEEPVSMVSSPGKRRRQDRQKYVHPLHASGVEPLTLASPAARSSRTYKPDLIEEAQFEEFARALRNNRGSLPQHRGFGESRRQSWN